MSMPGARFKQSGAINLVLVAVLMMVLTLTALSFLYYMRYGHVPLQDVWQRWSKSAEVVTTELSELGKDGVLSGNAATVDTGIRRCTINGKVLFSDVECSDSNPTTRAVKLVDNKGGEPPKASATGKGQDAVQAAVQADTEVDLKTQMIDKIVK
jgi:hypothetical protein